MLNFIKILQYNIKLIVAQYDQVCVMLSVLRRRFSKNIRLYSIIVIFILVFYFDIDDSWVCIPIFY